jgi:hypothetical protein
VLPTTTTAIFSFLRRLNGRPARRLFCDVAREFFRGACSKHAHAQCDQAAQEHRLTPEETRSCLCAVCGAARARGDARVRGDAPAAAAPK